MEERTHVLLIEDNPADIRLVHEMIKEFKTIRVDLHHEDRLHSAMELLRNRSFDLIILDLSLPDSSGLSGLEEFMRCHSEFPVLIMTSCDDEKTGIEAMRMGAQDFLIKGRIVAHALERIIRYAIERKRSEVELKKALDYAECRRMEVLALYNGAHSVLNAANFESAARNLFDICKKLIGATAGYVAILSTDGQNSEVLFVDSGGHPCTVDPHLPLPIQGLRAEAYLTRKVVFENNFKSSHRAQSLPKGHALLESVLFAPLVKNEKAVGLIGLANKPGGFTPEDAQKISAFSDLAAIALRNAEQSETLHSHLNFMETLINTIPNPVFYKNTSGKFIGCNHAFADQVLGIPEDDIKGRSVFDFPDIILPHQAKLQTEQDIQLIKIGGLQSYEDVLQCADGKIRDFSIDKTVFYGSGGNIAGIVGIFQDITERKKLEKQLLQSQKMEALGTLAGGIAHDFNNILTPILGYTEMLLEDMPEMSIQHQNLNEVLLSARRAKDLVKQILTFSRQTETRSVPVRMRSIVEEAVKLIQSSLPATIEVSLNMQSSGVITANPTQIHQVIMNLCTNAYQAMRKTGGKLEIILSDEVMTERESISDLKTGEYIRLRISDNGEGIPDKNLDRIFEPYFTTRGKGEGTGLGLAMVHGIVNACGGNVSVTSKMGKGTTFDVIFPRAAQKDILNLMSDNEPVQSGSGRILLIDDEPQIIKMTTIMLNKMGYEVFAETEWKAALDAFIAAPQDFDLVITDMTMPGMTGDRLAEKFMDIRPNLPVIICTGYSELLNRDQAREKGISDLLLKPLSRTKLAKAVCKAIQAAHISKALTSSK